MDELKWKAGSKSDDSQIQRIYKYLDDSIEKARAVLEELEQARQELPAVIRRMQTPKKS